MTLITQQANESVHINADWDGSEYSNTSGLAEGVLLESARTQMLANPTVPATQDVTVTAVAHTMSVLGTGSVTLSGTATGTATEASPLTFTPTAGTLTVTVAGSLDGFQLEIGSFASSFIPETITRAATQMSATLADMGVPSTLVNDISLQFTFTAKADGLDITGKYLADFFSDVSYANRASFIVHGSGRLQLYKSAGGLTSYSTSIANIVNGGRYVVAARLTTTTLDLWVNGVLGSKSSTGNEGASFLTPITKVMMGTNRTATSGSFITLESCSIWPEAKSDEFMEALT